MDIKNFSTYLILCLLVLIVLVFSLSECSTPQSNWKENLIHYIHSLAKGDGGYGWIDQPDSHLTPTFAVVGILHDINKLPSRERRKELVNFVRMHHPQFGDQVIQALLYKQKHHVTYLGAKWKKGSEAGSSGSALRNLIYQQIQAMLWLGGNASDYDQLVHIWQSQAGNIGNYEKHGYPVLYQEMMTPVCRHLLGINLSDSSHTIVYLQSRRRQDGSFNNAPAKDGGDGNILNTYWNLYGLHILGKDDTLQEKTIHWIQDCQLKNGGFTHQPNPRIGGNSEVAYTWAAVKALQLLSAEPARKKACIRYLLSLRNADGGFGNRPGLPSTPMSTYYAIDALKTLHAFSYLKRSKKVNHPQKKRTNFGELNIYTVQFEASGVGSPSEAVMLADSLHIQLWGAKNGPKGWIARAQEIADKKQIPVTFFTSDEPYGRFVDIKGMGSFGHILDFMAPAGITLPSIGNDLSWQEYHNNYVRPLLNKGGALLLQISNNEPLARLLLDESINNGGYRAISTIHMSQDFLFFLPYLYQYRYQLPFISLQDAHGSEPWWWSNDLVGFRTLFLAKKPTYQALMKALKRNWVVAVRHDYLTKYKTRMLGGAFGVQKYIMSHLKKWKWWGKDPHKLNRPWAAITIVRPSDSLEATQPKKGVNINIRCWWKTNSVAVLENAVVKLKKLRIDHKLVKPEHIERRGRRGRLMDSYYLYQMPKISFGEHEIKIRLINLNDNSERLVSKSFMVNSNTADLNN